MEFSELQRIAAEYQAQRKPIRIRYCHAAGCQSCGSLAVAEALQREVSAQGLTEEVEVCPVGCMRLCGRGCLVDIQGKLYERVRPEDAPSLVASIKDDSITPTAPAGSYDHPFFAYQLPIVLENCGKINPEEIDEYIAVGGYQQLEKVLHSMTPQEVIREITISGLRGRGGAGYPTGLKWSTVAKMPKTPKYVVCNADEGDPGAFMDRSVLESDPHRVLEGMAIAAYAVGANQGYIYVRAEYPLAISRLQKAIQQAKRREILGSQIFGSTFDFKIDIRVGAGAFVCGEETALMASIEGKRGNPRPRPPYPAESGLWGCPTLINNVETFANVVPIIREGGEWFSRIGTATSKGTKVFALTGKVKNTGLIEVPMGTTLHRIVMEMGEGCADGKKVKAVQTGGPSGGCVPVEYFDTPVDYESLKSLGTIMGSGGMIVVDEDTNMVGLARYYMEFCRGETCGKCIPCRTGTVQLYQMLTKILSGEATEKDLESLRQLSALVKETSLCGLGQTAPNPVLSTLRFFEQEYKQLLKS